ncbi:MAG TPA: DUF3159 domain-containing protein, partial [Pseudonocardiaceae bacterium]|nr:DUF3159 domain-containing protein [Pseudonocardiaceae bacterium]
MTESVPEHATDGSPARREPRSARHAPTVLEQMGGVGGMVASAVPVVAFVVLNPFIGWQSAIWASLGVALALGVWRLLRREALQPAVSGVLGVALCAFIAH